MTESIRTVSPTLAGAMKLTCMFVDMPVAPRRATPAIVVLTSTSAVRQPPCNVPEYAMTRPLPSGFINVLGVFEHVSRNSLANCKYALFAIVTDVEHLKGDFIRADPVGKMNSSIDSDDGGNQRELSEGSDVLLPQCSVLADEEYLWSKDIVLQDQFQSRLGDNFAVIQEMAIMLNSALMMDSATIKTGCSAVDLEQRLRGLNYMTLKGIYELCGGMSDSARVSRDQVLQLPCFSTVIETVKQEDVYLYKAVIFPGVEELTNSILENGQLFNMKSEILRSKKMSRHSNPLDAYQAKVLCNFLCELIAKLSRESPSNKNGVMYQHLQERFAKLKSGQGANAELELIGKYEEVLDFDKNKSLKELIKNMGKRSSILKLLGMPIFEPISSNDGIDPSRPTVFLCLQQGFNIPPYDEMDLEETKNRRPSGKKATKQRKNEAKATAMTGKDTSEEAEENESALSPNAEGPSSWDSDSDSDSDSESETYVQAETENEVLNDPQPVAEKVISPLDRATKVRQASMQQRSVPIWQAEDEPDDEEIVMYSDDEVSEEQIAERETRLKAKRQMEKMMEKTRLENLEKNLEAQRKKDEFRCLNEEADQIGKYLRARNWYKAVECRQPMSGGGLASASANGDQFQLLNVFSVRPPEDAFQSEFRPVATPLLSRSSSANSQSDFELPNQQPGSSASSSPPTSPDVNEEVVKPRNDNKENRERRAEAARKETTEPDGQVLRVMAPSQQTKQGCSSSESGPAQHIAKRRVVRNAKTHYIPKGFMSAVSSRLESNDIATRPPSLTPSVALPSYQNLTGQSIFITKENPLFARSSPPIPISPHCIKATPLAAANLPLQPPRSLSTTSVPLQQSTAQIVRTPAANDYFKVNIVNTVHVQQKDQPPVQAQPNQQKPANNLTPSPELFIPTSNSSSYFQSIESASVSRQNQDQMPTPLVHPQPINPTVVQQSERKKVQNWDEPSSSQQQQQASNQPTQKPKPKPMPLKVQTRQLRDAPPGIEGPLDYHDKKHRPQFPGEVAKHHANAKVSEFDQFKKKIETLEGNGDGSKPKMAFNMMTERRYSGHNSEVVRLPFVQKPLTFGKLGEKIDRTSPASASATPPSVRNSSPPRRASPPNESRQPSYDFHRYRIHAV
ncbi:hypothetical protein WR25_25142 isoform D [Diploscapter pachys]|uniref:Uncharacterized protein n=1 Tax=Diploscapter pachys TaxID=2018661 RepID=A0A2A2LVW1_9BILA|nr:hypothetical protein WR25_25142 isoform D [Diploscapter pachys]